MKIIKIKIFLVSFILQFKNLYLNHNKNLRLQFYKIS